MEKPDKSKRILMFEFDVLKALQGISFIMWFSDQYWIGLNHIPPVNEFIERNHGQPNFIVMKLLGKNLANRKKEMASNFTLDYVIDYLVKFIKFTYL